MINGLFIIFFVEAKVPSSVSNEVGAHRLEQNTTMAFLYWRNLLRNVLLCFLVLFPSFLQQASAKSIWNMLRRKQRKEIVIHRIKSPRLVISFLVYDLRLGIDDPGIYYDHMADITEDHNGSVLYLATWKDELPIIGMVEVYLDYWSVQGENGDDETLGGLWLDDVVTATKYQRMGVATALFKAIETDVIENQLMETMVELSDERRSLTKKKPGPSIDIRLHSVKERPALHFYLAMGYRFDPGHQGCEPRSNLGKALKRLHWIWLCGVREQDTRNYSQQLVKTLDRGDAVQNNQTKVVLKESLSRRLLG